MKNKVEYEIEMENTCTTFSSLDEAKMQLEKILHDESNYNYKINKNNKYCILKNIYDGFEEDSEILNSDSLCNTISVAEYRDMDSEEKENFFASIKDEC